MNFVNDMLNRLHGYSWLLGNKDLLELMRYITQIASLLSFILAIYRNFQKKREQAHGQFATAKISRDAKTSLPIISFPIKKMYVPFPLMASNLEARTADRRGWYTITGLYLWNAGKKPLWGSTFNPTMKAHIEIKEEVGNYALRACLSNDISTRLHIGRGTTSASGQQRFPIYFDTLYPDKGVLIEIWHSAEDDSGISINAISDQSPYCVAGVPHILKPKLVRWTNLLALWLVLPFAALTSYFIFLHETGTAILFGTVTWMQILLLWQQSIQKPLVPEDLNFRNNEARIFFHHGRR